MTSFPAGHHFEKQRIERRRVDDLADVPAALVGDVDFAVGEPSPAFAMRAGISGFLDASAFGSRWLNRDTIVFQRSITHLDGALFLGQGIVVGATGRIAQPSSLVVKPDKGEAIASIGGRLVAAQDVEVTAQIDEPLLYLGHCPGQIGHFLMDYASRTWAIAWARARGLRIGLYMPKDNLSEDFRALNAALGVPEDMIILTQPTRLASVFLPSKTYQLNQGVHPIFFSLLADLADHIAPSASSFGPRLYLSRRRWTKRRSLLNEEAVEAVFRHHGFAIVYPETLPITEQLAMLRDAVHLAGPIGSQMLMGAFARALASTTIITPPAFMLPDDAILANARGAAIHYVLGKADPTSAAKPRDRDFTVAVGLVEERLAAQFG